MTWNYIKFKITSNSVKCFMKWTKFDENSMKLDSMRVYVYDDYFWDVKIQWNHIEMRRKWFSKHLKFNCETSNSIVKHQIRHEITSKSDMKFNCETSKWGEIQLWNLKMRRKWFSETTYYTSKFNQIQSNQALFTQHYRICNS